tara:strand:+ start:20685 stop:21167 length:483 start_codon:yes stop_codon:yes gene_type:complete
MTYTLQSQLSDNFTMAELVRSRTAKRKGISNWPPAATQLALAELALNILQPVRNHFGKPVVVTSGYRSPRLNRAIGGSGTSQHCLGQAADFTVAGVSNLVVANWIDLNLPFDQLIYEFGEDGWLHCSYGPRDRRQTLSAVKRRNSLGVRRTAYLAGLGRV